MARMMSCLDIQLRYCAPESSLPPSPSLNIGPTVATMPPAALSTTLIRMVATRIPASEAGAVAFSHSTPTPARKSDPGAASSVRSSSPLSP